MDFNCEMLGISQEEMQNRVVNAIAEKLMSKTIMTQWDENEDQEKIVNTKFAKAVIDKINEHFKNKVDELFNEQIAGKIDNLLTNYIIKETNQLGESLGKERTVTEFIIERFNVFIKEQVDSKGNPKRKNDCYFKPQGTRLTVAVDTYFKDHLEKAMKTILKNTDKTLIEEVTESFRKIISTQLKRTEINVKRS